MKERPVIFNADMVRAILNGRKTQTRRPVKFPFLDINMGCELAGNELAGELAAGNYWNSPFGQPGDRLWVRETFGSRVLCDAAGGTGTFTVYRASNPDAVKYVTATGKAIPIKWKPSIHMPRWASRITLEITGVRVERLKDISASDALDEGIQHMTMNCPRHEFFQLWNNIYGDMAHETNPWLWVITFRRVA